MAYRLAVVRDALAAATGDPSSLGSVSSALAAAVSALDETTGEPPAGYRMERSADRITVTAEGFVLRSSASGPAMVSHEGRLFTRADAGDGASRLTLSESGHVVADATVGGSRTVDHLDPSDVREWAAMSRAAARLLVDDAIGGSLQRFAASLASLPQRLVTSTTFEPIDQPQPQPQPPSADSISTTFEPIDPPEPAGGAPTSTTFEPLD